MLILVTAFQGPLRVSEHMFCSLCLSLLIKRKKNPFASGKLPPQGWWSHVPSFSNARGGLMTQSDQSA